jgi:dihydrofolate synthase/folylpolyglutamate synthase
MNYQEAIDYLYHSTPVFEHVGASAYKEGLENTLALDQHFNHPHRQYKTIHIAGTNGKGSCSHTIASILQEAGYKVGLYTSPHLVDFRERIRVNGQCVSEKYVIEFIEHERSFFEPLHPSFFELTTAMAFKYFAEQQVDVAVIEVGLGGRLDCTNIISPILSVITNISFDHTGFLGDTLAKIASEKAGIIKKGVPVVIGEYTDETRPVFEKKAKELNAPITFAQDVEELGKDIAFELKGDYQQKNKQTILAAISILTPTLLQDLNEATIRKGLTNVVKNTGLMGRWQTIQDKPKVVCDTGHNVGGWQYLSQQIQAQPCRQLRIVFGMVDDKDIDSVMELLPKNAVYYWTQADNHRAIPSATVQAKAEKHKLTGNSFNSVASAYEAALHDAHSNDFIFIGGSSYVVADLLQHVRNRG